MKPSVLVVLVVLLIPVLLVGCSGRSLVEEKNLLEGVQVIVDGPVTTLEKIVNGKIDPSQWDDEDRETQLKECRYAKEFLKKEKDRY